MTDTAKVISTSGRLAEIEVSRRSMCDGCGKNSCAGSCAVIGLMSSRGIMRTTALNRAGALPGDTVVIESSDGRILSLAVLVFILPIFVSILFYAVASAAGFEGVLPVLAAVGGFVLSFVALGAVERVHRRKEPDIIVSQIVERGTSKELAER